MTQNATQARLSVVWLLIRLYVGYQWLHAGWGKLTGGGFDASGFIQGAINKADPAVTANPTVQAWWASFLKGVAMPNIELFNFLVPVGEFLVGLALIFGFATIFAACMGALMNFSFMMSGSLSSNPVLFALEFILVAAGGAYAGFLGVDYWFRPWFRQQLARFTRNRRRPVPNPAT